jgi:trigger factor
MQVQKHTESETEVTVAVAAGSKELRPLKDHVLTHFQHKVKVPGFRPDKVPPEIIEKNVDQNTLQTEFLQEAVEGLYVAAINELRLRPASQPEISIKKFVPFTQLEFEAKLEVIGKVTLPDYTKIKKPKPQVKITEKDVSEVISSLQKRLADKKDTDRASKNGDQLWIDFEGVDAKTKEPVKGADGKDYPIILGSKTFIPGFEDELAGLKTGDEKTFTLTFPTDYGVKALASKKVEFKVSVTKVQEVIEPKVDDAFAAKAGPFKTVAELKKDIRAQLEHERKHEAEREFESELVKEISDRSTVAVPKALVNNQIERLLQELSQNLAYRGQTFPEFLESEGKTEDEYRDKVLRPQAEERVKAGLVLSEIAEKENLAVTPEELAVRIQILKGQYQDSQMQAELDKQETGREIASRLLTEKTVGKLVEYATK